MRDKFRCQYCGEKKTAAELTLDHILPRSRGGDNSPVNIVAACVPCNNRKSDRTPAEARMPLLTSQSALRVKLERVVLCHYAEARAEWRKYLFMDVHDDRDVMEKVRNEREVLGLGLRSWVLGLGQQRSKTKTQRPKTNPGWIAETD